MCIKQQNYTISEAKTDGIKGTQAKSRIPVGDFNLPLSATDETTRQKITRTQNSTTLSTNRINIYQTSSQQHQIHFLSKCSWEYIKVGHILGHKTNPNKFLKIEIIQNVFSDQMESLTEINNRKITGKPLNTGELNLEFLDYPRVTKSQEKFYKYIPLNENMSKFEEYDERNVERN